MMGAYACQHNYWWELLYLTIRGIIRGFVKTKVEMYPPDSKAQTAYIKEKK